jgi:hypothetical protein
MKEGTELVSDEGKKAYLQLLFRMIEEEKKAGHVKDAPPDVEVE